MPSKRALAVGAGQPVSGGNRCSPQVAAALLDRDETWIAVKRHQELAVAAWGAVAESDAKRPQKKQEKAVSGRSWLGGVSDERWSEQEGEINGMQLFQSPFPRRSRLPSSVR